MTTQEIEAKINTLPKVSSTHQLDLIFEELKPLNFGRKIVFIKYCEGLIKDGVIEKSYLEKFILRCEVEVEVEEVEEETFSLIKFFTDTVLSSFIIFGILSLFKY